MVLLASASASHGRRFILADLGVPLRCHPPIFRHPPTSLTSTSLVRYYLCLYFLMYRAWDFNFRLSSDKCPIAFRPHGWVHVHSASCHDSVPDSWFKHRFFPPTSHLCNIVFSLSIKVGSVVVAFYWRSCRSFAKAGGANPSSIRFSHVEAGRLTGSR